MKLKLEDTAEKQQVLFIGKSALPAVSLFMSDLEKYALSIHLSKTLPERLEKYSYIFFFDEFVSEGTIQRLEHIKSKSLILLFDKIAVFKTITHKVMEKKTRLIKIVHLNERALDRETREKILWFLFSATDEVALDLRQSLHPTGNISSVKPKKVLKITRKKLVFFVLLLFLSVELFFIIPFFATGVLLFQSYTSMKNQQFAKADYFLGLAGPTLAATQKSYSLSRPLLSFFFLALIPDATLTLEETSYQLLQTTVATQKNLAPLFTLITNKNRGSQETEELTFRLKTLKQETQELSLQTQKLADVAGSLPNFISPEKREILQDLKRTLPNINKLAAKLDKLLGVDAEKKYLLFFYNNMEIRPGGGFLGSFGVVTFSGLTLKNLAVYDVYDADGQLKGHIEPPEAIRAYLKQPHWFLRDSNFSPDFPQNVKTAGLFLEKEIGLTHFDGALGITTTGVNNILKAVGPVYLPDYNETVTADNFYIKTQIHAENNFFPGSMQKETFLSSLVRNLMLKFEDTSSATLLKEIKTSMDEKQIVLYMEDPSIEKILETSGWAGRAQIPQCTATNGRSQCIATTVFPVDANLGVNKANFFVSRFMKLIVDFRQDGQIYNTFTTTFKNNSPEEVFPGGPYHNFFRLFIPENSTDVAVYIDGKPATNWKETTTGFLKVVSLYFTVPPKSSAQVSVKYKLADTVKKGEGQYQATVQKQIGALNNDLSLEFHFADNMSLIPKNFSAVAKRGIISYNTTLSTDKIFLIGYLKK